MATALTRAEHSLWHLVRGPYGALLCWLVALSVFAPWLGGGRYRGLALDLINCGVLLTGLRAAHAGRKTMLVGSLLVVGDLVTHATAFVLADRPAFAVHYALTFLILAFTTLTILSAILRNSQVTLETLKAAICVYLLFGLVWVFLFALIDEVHPHSFRVRRIESTGSFDHPPVSESFPRLIYFSYATLTTLGYGDILPVSGPAQAFSYLEAIVGQLYLTVLIARLVGMHITQSSGEVAQRPRD
jgi:hypothetical protein